jgi:prevent-host-death family protein
MPKIMSVSKVQPEIFKLLKDVSSGGEPVIITKRGEGIAVLIGEEEYKSLIATIEVLSSPELMESIRESEKEISEGKLIPYKKVFEKT